VINEKHAPDLDITQEKAQHALCTGELTQVRRTFARVAKTLKPVTVGLDELL
jgi:hypothetical protein